MTWGKWFKAGRVDVRWLRKSPSNRTSRCDLAWNHVVRPDEPRLQADTGHGPTRKRGKGKQHEYLCQGCAERIYGLKPPSIVEEDQERLF